jgi:putative transposase
MGLIRKVINERPASYGYRRVYAMLKATGVHSNPKTINRYMGLRLLLSSSRLKIFKKRLHREGTVAVAEPNKRWASDITQIKAWNGEKGRLAILIDCGDRQVLGFKWARQISGRDIQEMVKTALSHRLKAETVPQGTLEFLSDNGPEYIQSELRNSLAAAGLVVCNTPIRSPESNGVAESFFKTFKRDYVYQNMCESFADIESRIADWIEDYNTRAPHSGLGMLTPVKFYENWLQKAKL